MSLYCSEEAFISSCSLVTELLQTVLYPAEAYYNVCIGLRLIYNMCQKPVHVIFLQPFCYNDISEKNS